MKAKDLIAILEKHPEAEIRNLYGIEYDESMDSFIVEDDPEEGRY